MVLLPSSAMNFRTNAKPIDVAKFCIDKVLEACALQKDLEMSFILARALTGHLHEGV